MGKIVAIVPPLPVPRYPLHPSNRYKVPERQWRRWPEIARVVFNAQFQQMREQRSLQHPKMATMPKEHWRTIAWNSAWLAADNVRDCLKTWAEG